MWNFRKIIETADTRYLYVLESDYQSKIYPDANKWHDLFWDYLKVKGIDYKSRLRLDLQVKIELLKSEEIFEGKKNNVKIVMTQLKLDNLNKSVEKGSDIGNDIILWKYMGTQIDPKKTTVAQYIALEKSLEEQNEAIKNNGRNN